MTLEIEKLTIHLEEMARSAAKRKVQQNERLVEYQQTLNKYATDWERIEQALATAVQKADDKFYRSAKPFDTHEPLNTAVDPPPPPAEATIIATDGSQILPDRHAAYLYYLINIGGIIYHHGQGIQPDIFSLPAITYPSADIVHEITYNSGDVSIERDIEEIGMLAKETVKNRHLAAPLFSILDQRLLYWPIGTAGVAENTAVTDWSGHMTTIRQAGALLAGYIDRPGTSYVATLLLSLTGVGDPDFDWRVLGKSGATQGVTDLAIFRQLLLPGQRSKVFVNVSQPNDHFAAIDSKNEVCFFYLNPTNSSHQIARIDIPRWVAEDETAVAAVHSLIISQCRIMGDYPYVLARADEMAVVGRRDAAELNGLLDVIMDRHGVGADITAKSGSKELARSGKTRHEGY